jgi:hypothetical protein
LAARFFRVYLFQLLLYLAINDLTKEEENKLLLATDNEGWTVFLMAVEGSEI